MDDTRTAASALSALSHRTGVEQYRLAMFGALASLPLVSTVIAIIAASV